MDKCADARRLAEQILQGLTTRDASLRGWPVVEVQIVDRWRRAGRLDAFGLDSKYRRRRVKIVLFPGRDRLEATLYSLPCKGKGRTSKKDDAYWFVYPQPVAVARQLGASFWPDSFVGEVVQWLTKAPSKKKPRQPSKKDKRGRQRHRQARR